MIYDWETENAEDQAKAQAIVDAVNRCSRGEHDPEPLALWGDGRTTILVCQFCGVRV